MQNKSLEERLRLQAYHLWEADGRPHGRSEEYWQKARALLESDNASASADQPSSGAAVKRTTRSKAKATALDTDGKDAPKAKSKAASKPAAKKSAKTKTEDAVEKKPKALAETPDKPAKKTTAKSKAAADAKPSVKTASKSASKPSKAVTKAPKK